MKSRPQNFGPYTVIHEIKGQRGAAEAGRIKDEDRIVCEHAATRMTMKTHQKNSLTIVRLNFKPRLRRTTMQEAEDFEDDRFWTLRR